MIIGPIKVANFSVYFFSVAVNGLGWAVNDFFSSDATKNNRDNNIVQGCLIILIKEMG